MSKSRLKITIIPQYRNERDHDVRDAPALGWDGEIVDSPAAWGEALFRVRQNGVNAHVALIAIRIIIHREED